MGKVILSRKIIENFKDACDALAVKVNKQLFDDYRTFYWIGDEVGGLCDFEETDILSPCDMVLIIERKVKYKQYAEWRDYNLEHEGKYVNLRSWLDGFRPEGYGKEQ